MINVNTNDVISGSNSRIEGEPSSPNIRADPLTTPKVIKSRYIDKKYADPPSTHLEL